MTTSDRVAAEFKELLEAANRIYADPADEVRALIEEGIERPLTKAEARRLLQKIVRVVRDRARANGDPGNADALADASFVDELMAVRGRIGGRGPKARAPGDRLRLADHNGIPVRPVQPNPTFHGREVPMMGGWVRLSDLELWDENERLDVHVNQFEQEHGRPPGGDELLHIMLSELPLKGLEDDDQFKITALARSIANNGVRKQPIIDLDGTLLDGNRRVSACQHILRSDEFTADQKRRVEWLFVWQLTDHATDRDRDSVVVSLNFEPDNKEDWPEYVKARRIYDEYQRLLNLEPRSPSAPRILEIKKEVSRAFALGPTVGVVNRYIKMVEVADEFEEYHVVQRGRDEFAVKHAATKRFQYFDELGKGSNPGGVAHTLGRDDALKRLVFDLLLEGKFRNWTQIRDLKHVPDNPDMLEHLQSALKDSDTESAKERVDEALDIVRSRRAEKRRLGANQRIESFVDFLEDLPLATFRDSVSTANLEKLLGALKLVRHQAADVLGDQRVAEILG